MLKETVITAIAEKLKIDPAKFKTAITATDEQDVEIPSDIHILTTEELATRDENKLSDGKRVGREIGIKEFRKAAGLDDSLGKDPEKIIQAISAKVIADAKIEPDKKVTELTQQITTLRSTIAEKDTEISTLSQRSAEVANDTKLLAAFPKNRSSVLTDQEYLRLLKGKITIKQDEKGNDVVELDGKVAQDKLANPLPIADVVNSIFTERSGWIDGSAGGSGGAGGRGAGDNGSGGVITKKSELIAKYEKEGKNMNGTEFIAELQQLAKENKEFDLVG